MDLRAKRDLNNGFGNVLSVAMELALVPTIFALIGYWVDGRLGTRPLFLVAMILFAVTGLGVRSYYEYKARMEKEDVGKPWSRA